MFTIIDAMNSMASRLQTCLCDKGKITRPRASPGIWMSFLLPVAVLGGAATHKVSKSYRLAAILCIGFLGSSLSFVIHTHKNQKIRWLRHLSMICTATLLFIFNERGIIISIAGALISTVVYEEVLPRILAASPKTLTYGEANVIVQAVLLFTCTSVLHLCENWSDLTNGCMQISTVILEVGLLGVLLICTLVYLWPNLRKTTPFYILVTVITVFGILPILHLILQRSPILWILELLITKSSRTLLVIHWVMCSTFAILAVVLQIQKGKLASTSIRKYFHILTVTVYIPGIVTECGFLFLASGIVLALFIILETMRILQIYPLAETLQSGFDVFADEKDAGTLALTPIYLLVGCSLPLWIHPSPCLDCSSSKESILLLSSGVLSIGIGDTSASVFGSWIGKHKWKGTQKTIEGTAASIVTQMTSIALLVHFDVAWFFHPLMAADKLAVKAVTSGEANIITALQIQVPANIATTAIKAVLHSQQ